MMADVTYQPPTDVKVTCIGPDTYTYEAPSEAIASELSWVIDTLVAAGWTEAE